jgi:methionyl-tRNA synthetase
LVGRLNADLANNLGNLLQRTLGMVGRYLSGRIPAPGEAATEADRRLREAAEGLPARVAEAMQGFAFHRALEAIWGLLDVGNQYIADQKPWELAKRDAAALGRVLGHACETLRLVSLHLSPFMPSTAQAIWSRLGLVGGPDAAPKDAASRWGGMTPGQAVEGPALFPRVDLAAEAAAPPETPAPAPQSEIPQVTIDEFRRIDLRVAQVLAAKAVRGAKKLVHLTISLGGEERSLVAGILLDYPPETLVGKQIVVVANLEPTKLMGVESRGMLLAATDAEGKLVLVAPERAAAVGCKVK